MTQKWIPRNLEQAIAHQLSRGKSVLLLGPRQTGKTSLLKRFEIDLSINLLFQKVRQDFERNPDHLAEMVASSNKTKPLVLIDEAQKVPSILDVVQALIDDHQAQFIITGSSARKLRVADSPNLLPGRVAALRLDPLSLAELESPRLEDLLLYGSLPQIYLEKNPADRENDLESYVSTFIEEEIRKEAAVRNVPAFSRFLELAAIDSGRVSNFSEISKQINVAHSTVASHYQVLCDCLVAERFDPITESSSRTRLTRSSRYVFFDLGVRRLAARQGTTPTAEHWGELFEQFIGLELLRMGRASRARVHFWRDPSGPEVDWVLAREDEWIPIEVKWTDRPTASDARHLSTFLAEYPKRAKHGYVVSRCDRTFKLAENVTALPWKKLGDILQRSGEDRS